MANQRDVKINYQLWAVRADACVAFWQARFLWLPINGIVEQDGAMRVTFSSIENGMPVCSCFDDWFEGRER